MADCAVLPKSFKGTDHARCGLDNMRSLIGWKKYVSEEREN